MPTTTKMGIVYPSSSDLVKDGATAMGTIATTVDAKSGLILLNTISFSAVSSQTITGLNTNYNNFRIVFKFTGASVIEQVISLRMSLNGSAANGSDYTFRGTSLTTGVNLSTGSNATSWFIGVNSNNAPANFGCVLDLIAASQTTRTNIHSFSNGFDNSQNRIITTHGVHNVATSYNEVVLFADTGNFTGEASLYGYNK